jgi:hypothetical protein
MKETANWQPSLVEIKLFQCCLEQRVNVMDALLREFDNALGDQLGCRVRAKGEPKSPADRLEYRCHVAKRFRLKSLTGKEWSDWQSTPQLQAGARPLSVTNA